MPLPTHHPQVDILHPLATLTWTQCAASLPHGHTSTQCVYFNDRLYLRCNLGQVLYVITSDFTECEMLSVPVQGFGLTHYNSQLVLVGGIDEHENPTNKVWASADGTSWQPSLPPMRMKCRRAAATNTGRPECLVVTTDSSVEVFANNEWFTVTSSSHMTWWWGPLRRVHVHNGTVLAHYRYQSSYCRSESLIQLPQANKEESLPTFGGNLIPLLITLHPKFHLGSNLLVLVVPLECLSPPLTNG